MDQSVTFTLRIFGGTIVGLVEGAGLGVVKLNGEE